MTVTLFVRNQYKSLSINDDFAMNLDYELIMNIL